MYAQEILGELYERGDRNPETLELYADLWMGRYKRSRNLDHIRQACDLYTEVFEAVPLNYLAGLRAAKANVIIGEYQRAQGQALGVQKVLGTKPSSNDFWKAVDLAETFLILEDYEQALVLYDFAVFQTRNNKRSKETAWRQACVLMEALGTPTAGRFNVRQPFADLPECESLEAP